MSTSIKKDTQIVIKDTKESLKDMLRQARKVTEQKLEELKQTAEQGLEELSQHAQFIEEQTQQRAMAAEANIHENVGAIAESVNTKTADIVQAVRGSAESAKAQAKQQIQDAHARADEVFNEARTRIDKPAEAETTTRVGEELENKEAVGEAYEAAMDEQVKANQETRKKALDVGEPYGHKKVDELSAQGAFKNMVMQDTSDIPQETEETGGKGIIGYMTSAAKSAVGKVESLGSSIKEAIVGGNDTTATELETERKRLAKLGGQLNESASEVAEQVREKGDEITGKIEEDPREVIDRVREIVES